MHCHVNLKPHTTFSTQLCNAIFVSLLKKVIIMISRDMYQKSGLFIKVRKLYYRNENRKENSLEQFVNIAKVIFLYLSVNTVQTIKSLQIVTSWVREQSSLIGDNHCFKKFCCLHLQFCSDNGSCRFPETLVIANEAI